MRNLQHGKSRFLYKDVQNPMPTKGRIASERIIQHRSIFVPLGVCKHACHSAFTASMTLPCLSEDRREDALCRVGWIPQMMLC
jgi:hypothetical protein